MLLQIHMSRIVVDRRCEHEIRTTLMRVKRNPKVTYRLYRKAIRFSRIIAKKPQFPRVEAQSSAILLSCIEFFIKTLAKIVRVFMITVSFEKLLERFHDTCPSFLCLQELSVMRLDFPAVFLKLRQNMHEFRSLKILTNDRQCLCQLIADFVNFGFV